jgi:hypothetical protein
MYDNSIHARWAEDLNKKYISMDNRRKCTYDIDYKTPQPYTIQTVTTEPGDVILAHVSEDLDLDTVNEIWKQLKVAFPNNDVLIANEYILKGLTIIKPKTGTVNIHNHVDTNTSDVLDKWLHQNVEFNI